MFVRLCDRCGEIIKEFEDIYDDFSQEKDNYVDQITIDKYYLSGCQDEVIHLCPNCMKDFRNFLSDCERK